MELKPYQQAVLNDLDNFLDYVQKYKKSNVAFEKYWEDRVGVYNPLDGSGMEPYKNNVPNAPHVCIKVPTAGGKTFIAFNALRVVFNHFDTNKTKAVVWLVPSVTILEQTIKNLSNPLHPYRQKLNTHFNSRVEVYDKDALLQASGFNPTSVKEQLSIFILSFDSLRAKRKEDRKIYQENGALAPFVMPNEQAIHLLREIPDSSLINVIRALNPVVVVDESHNAETALSIEMLSNLNPSFILDLTATPRNNSNIISYVDAFALKRENMVKLPVIVYNHKDRNGVIESAINLQKKLEAEAQKEEHEGGRHIRPIVLFQAQPRTDEDNTTFERIKQILIDLRIPESQIKIKTASINEIKDVDLMDKYCEVRYIITVNALKEGWDCPYAYILASVADKSSAVDVEQILGRVLRQPFVTKHANPLLNMSYVLTASQKFRETLQSIVEGLNKAGFSKKDYKVILDETQLEQPTELSQSLTQLTITENEPPVSTLNEVDTSKINITETQDLGSDGVLTSIEIHANELNTQFEQAILDAESENTVMLPTEIQNKLKTYRIKEIFKEDAEKLVLPQFFLTVPGNNLFGTEDEQILLSKDLLLEEFKLSNENISINFNSIASELYKVDLEKIKKDEYTPTFSQVEDVFREPLIKYLISQPKETQIKTIGERMFNLLGNMPPIADKEVKTFVKRIVENLNPEQVTDLLSHEYSYRDKIKEKINALSASHAEKQFSNWLDTDKITAKGYYQLKKQINPPKPAPAITKSLYEKEGEINDFEQQVINEIANLPNVLFWHRNPERTGFCINGFINHYPDFIVQTKSGKTLVIEIKGDWLDGEDSKAKIRLGRAWANKAGNNYRYFMVFENKEIPEAYSLEKVIPTIKAL